MESFGEIIVDELELRRIAQVDQLTGAFTRRAFQQETEKTISSHRRNGRDAMLVLLDIDHFKQINDTFGHPAGDRVLKSVSAILMKLLRTTDIFGRLGGEEFGIILPETNAGQANEIAERLRFAVELLNVCNDPPLKVTASFGLATLDQSCLSFEAWHTKADLGLYSAKRAGRNQCCHLTA